MIRRVAAAILAVDGFTGEPIRDGSISMKMEDGGLPIKKWDGYYIFWDNGQIFRTLIVESGLFEQESVLINIEEIGKKKEPILTLYLIPGLAYPFPRDVRWKECLGKKDSILHIPIMETKGLITLARNYQAGESCLFIKKIPGLIVEGRELAFFHKGETQWESGEIWEVVSEDTGCCRLKVPLKQAYVQRETKILLTFGVRSDAEGGYLLPCMWPGC